jgi:glycosyltransferase involved in cell wall biosynthesis
LKVVLCVHGFPPEHLGGTERSAEALAWGLARRGHEVVVVAGSCEEAEGDGVTVRKQTEARDGVSFRLERWTRPDLYFDHWHKSKSARVGTAFRQLLRREQPDLVHVLHWLRLSRDLVAIASGLGIRTIISMGDSWINCPLTFRVLPESGEICDKALSPVHCIACSGRVAPRTPWVSMEAGFMQLGERTRDLALELQLAGARLVPSRSFGERLLAGLGAQAQAFEFDVVAPCAPAFGTEPKRDRSWETLRLGSWGGLSALKGTDLIFEAISNLTDPSQVELQLAGPENPAGYFEALSADYPAVRATYHGTFEARELPQNPVTHVHAMVSASRAPESFGIVLEEARALGLPAVLSGVGAYLERGGEERGALLFTAGNAESLGSTIQRLLESTGLLEDLGRRLPPARDSTVVTQMHLTVYERVLAGDAPTKSLSEDWYSERLVNFAEEEWDRALSACSPAELGWSVEEESP